MKITIEFALKTREVYQLFLRKINGDRLFIQSVLHKLNCIAQLSKQNSNIRSPIYQQIEQDLLVITQQFEDEAYRFEALLLKQKKFKSEKINVIAQFYSNVTVTNQLTMLLVQFIKTYDYLIAILQLLRLTDCFIDNNDYYVNIKRIQKLSNRLLSGIILIPKS